MPHVYTAEGNGHPVLVDSNLVHMTDPDPLSVSWANILAKISNIFIVWFSSIGIPSPLPIPHVYTVEGKGHPVLVDFNLVHMTDPDPTFGFLGQIFAQISNILLFECSIWVQITLGSKWPHVVLQKFPLAYASPTSCLEKRHPGEWPQSK